MFLSANRYDSVNQWSIMDTVQRVCNRQSSLLVGKCNFLHHPYKVAECHHAVFIDDIGDVFANLLLGVIGDVDGTIICRKESTKHRITV